MIKNLKKWAASLFLLLCAGALAFGQESYKFVWWDNGSADNAYLLGGTGNGVITALKDSALSFEVSNWSSSDANSTFGVTITDTQGNVRTEAAPAGVSQGSKFITSDVSAGDQISFWVESDGNRYDSLSSVQGDFLGAILTSPESLTLRFNSVPGNGTGRFILSLGGADAGSGAQGSHLSGQPLPGVWLSVVVLGITSLVYIKKRK